MAGAGDGEQEDVVEAIVPLTLPKPDPSWAAAGRTESPETVSAIMQAIRRWPSNGGRSSELRRCHCRIALADRLLESLMDGKDLRTGQLRTWSLLLDHPEGRPGQLYG